MALVACKECKTPISTDARQCPKCGAKPPKQTSAFTLIVTALVLLWAVGAAIHSYMSGRQEDAQRLAAQTAKNQSNAIAVTKCQQNPVDMIQSAEALARSQQFNAALEILEPCTSLHQADIDSSLNHIHELEKLGHLSVTPADATIVRKQIYTELVALVPSNPSYKEKLDYYTKRNAEQEAEKAKTAAQQAAKLAATTAKFGAQPDYVHGKVAAEMYVQERANDPDSIKFIECTASVPTKDGWLEKCQYRGKNAFGGLILVSHFFLIANGTVVREY